MAERWGEFLTDAPELPFFLAEIERFGQPVLDLACGSGRLLVPLLVAGVDVDGCDISQDMLDQCQRRAGEAGFSPTLSAQPMDSFAMARRYRTIYMCDSFGLAGSRAADLAALRRCWEHLEEGGALIFTIDAEYTDAESWDRWLPAARAALPEPWPDDGRRRVAADGTEHTGRFRDVALDPLNQTYTREVLLEKWRGGDLEATETYVLRGNMYLKSEVLLMLQVAGFGSVTVRGDYTAEMATPEHDKLVFTAIREESLARPAGLEPTTFRSAT